MHMYKGITKIWSSDILNDDTHSLFEINGKKYARTRIDV